MYTKLSRSMELAMQDLPIEHVPSESPLAKDREKMYWLGQSGVDYHYNTLKGLMIRGLIQFIQCYGRNNFDKLVKREAEHNTDGYKRYNQIFGVDPDTIQINPL